MSAPVEKRHRQLAYYAVERTEAPKGSVAEGWLECGGAILADEWNRVAQALADLEAATAHRAWKEGFACGQWFGSEPHTGEPCPVRPVNPYPAPEPKP